MAKGASSGISFDEYMRKKKEEEETKKEEPKKSTTSTDKKLSEPTNKSGKTFGESVYENYTSKNVNADSLKKWLTDVESTIKSTQDYISKNQFDKYNTDYGSEYSSKVGELLDSYDAISAFVKYNKDGFEDYDSISNTLDQYTKYLREFNSRSSSLRDYYSKFDSEGDYLGYIMTNTGDMLDVDSVKRRQDAYAYAKDRIAKSNNKEEKEQLQAYISQYERGNKSKDEAFAKYASRSDYEKVASNRDFGNSTMEDYRVFDTKAYGGEIVNHDTGERTYVEPMFDYSVSPKDAAQYIGMDLNINDPLGFYFSTIGDYAKDGESVYHYPKEDIAGQEYSSVLSQGDKQHWSNLKEDEIQMYYFLLNEQGKDVAVSFLNGLESELGYRETVEYAEYLKDASALEVVFANALSIPATLVGGTVALVDDAVGALKGEDPNFYDSAHGLKNFADTTRGVTAQTLNDFTNNASFLGMTTGDVYQSLMSGADSLAGGSIFGKAYLGLMSTGAMSSGVKDLYENGASTSQILTGSLINGAAEYIGEKIAFDHFFKMKGNTNSIGKLIASTLMQGGYEMGGEMVTELTNIVGEAINLRSQSEWAKLLKENDGAFWETVKELATEKVWKAGAGGFISGMLMGGGQTTADYLSNRPVVKAEGQYIMDQGGVEDLKALALDLAGQQKGISNFATKVSLKSQAGNVSNTMKSNGRNAVRVGQLSNSVDLVRDTANVEDIANSLIKEGVSKGKANEIAEHIYYKTDYDSLSKSTQKAMESDAVRKIVEAENTSVSKRNRQYAYARAGLKETDDGEVALSDHNQQKLDEFEKNILKADYAEKADAVKAKVSEDGTAKVIKTDTEVTLQGIDHIETVEKDGKEVDVAYLKVADADGNESVVEWGDVEFSSRNEAVLYETFVGMDIDPVHFDAFVKNFNEADFDGSIGEAAVQYAIGFRNAYRYGWANMETELGGDVFASKLTESVRNTAYTLGKETVTKQTEAKQKSLDTAVAERKASGKGKAKTKGKLNMKGVKTTKRTAMQNAGVGLAKRLTDLGIDVYVYESRKVNGQWVDENGNVAPNGYYRAKDGSIHIDLNAGEYGQGIMVYTLAHELTHFMRDKSPKQFKAFADLLVKWYGEKGETLNGLITKTMNDENLSWDDAYEEVIARSCESFLTDSNIADRILELQNTDKGLWETIRDKVLEFLKWMKSLFANVNPESYEGDLLHQYKSEIDHLYDAFYNTLADAVETNQWAGSIAEAKTNAETLATAGITVDANTGSAVMNSVRYAPKTQAEIDKVAKALSESMGVSIEKAKAWVKSETSLASVILDPSNAMFLDYEADDRYEAIKKNAEYPQGTVDFSNLCKKRREFTALLDKLQKEHPNRIITAEEMEKIRQILIEENVEVACGLCYVEERRQLLGEIAQGFIDGYKNGTLKENIAKELDGNDTYVPTIYDLITYDGYRALATEHPSIAEAFKKFNNARGMQAGRLIEGIAEYKRDILNWSQKKVDFVNSVGGLRVFSFSDFEATHLIDLVQVVQDCAAKGVMIQAYTKVPAFANAVKGTNIKVNRSLIANGTGIKYENGRMVLDLDPVEGININDKDFFDSTNSESVGNVLVGMSDEQIRLAMKTPFVDYIIPFHTGLKKDILKAKKIDHWDNYKNFQTDKDIATGKVAKNQINVYVDVIQAAEAEGKPIKNKVDFVNKFLAVAKEKGLKPRFWNFLDVDANGEYTYTEGYHKFLVDFKLFDQQGNILPQKPVVPEFDDALNARILNEYVEGKKAPVSRDAVYERLENEVINGESVKKSSRRDYSYNALVSKPDMPVTTIRGNVQTNRADIVAIAKRNAAKVGTANPDGSVSVHVNDIDTDVVLTTHGLRHGLRRKQQLTKANGIVTLMAGEIIQNSIRVNELTPADDAVASTYVLMGIARDSNGDIYIVRSVVNRYDNELVSMDALYAVNAKKELAVQNAPRLTAKPLSVTSSTISIADYLDYVNQYFPDTLPEDVLKHYGHTERPNGDLGEDVLFSRRGYAKVGSKAVMTEDRIDDLIEDSGAGRRVDYANYWITSISPTDFLNMTTTTKIQDRAVFDKFPSEWNDDATMDTYDYLGELKKNGQTPYLAININTGEVVGHEGRHRLRALEREGITSVEIMVEFKDDDYRIVKYSPDGKRLQIKGAVKIINQFGTGQTASIKNVIPLNKDYRDTILANYGEATSTSNSDIRYSRRVTAEQDAQYLELAKDPRKNKQALQEMVDEAAKKAGYPVKAYHGTSSFGFTKFDPAMSDDKTTLFFTDDMEVASTYAGRDIYRTKNVADAKSFKYERGKVYTEAELKEAHDFIQAKYHVYGVTKINVDKQTVTHAGTRYSAKQIIELADHISKEGIYGVYLNTDNTLELDAGYKGWSGLKNPDVVRWEWRIKYQGEGEFDYFKAKADDMFRLELLKDDENVHSGEIQFSEMFSLLRKALGANRAEMAIRNAINHDIGSSRFAEGYSDKNGNYINPTMNTREFAKYAKQKGYDGVVVKNLYDWGSKNPPASASFVRDRKGAATIYILFDSNRVKSADLVTYDEQGNVIPLSERFDSSNDDIRYQQRGTGMSNRSILANALESATQHESEARRLAEYKAKIDLINSEEQKLQETRLRIADLSFASGPKDTATIKRLQDTATRIANRINTYDKQLLNLEATAPLKALLEREKAMARKREKEKAADALAKYREKSAETLREVMNRNTESRKKSVESRKRTVVRNKIKRVVTDLNGLLNRGTKERNVKTDMQETVGSALKLANVLFNDEITNEDIVLMGSTMATEEEQKLLDQYVNLIKKRDSAPVGEAMRYINKMSDLNRKLADLFKRERARLNQAKVSEAVDELAKAYANLKVSDKDYVNAYYSEEAHKRLLNLSESLGGTVMKDMSLAQLEEVYDAYKMIRHIVRESNSLFRMGKTQDLAKTVTSVQEQILSLYKEREKDPRASAKKIGDFLKNFAWNEMKPLTAFETLGADAYTELFWDAIKAEGEWAKWMEEANAFLDEQRSKFNYKSWDMDTAQEFTLPDGKVFRLTLQEMLSIYAYSKREQAQEHMTVGGFQFDKHNVYKDNDKKKRVRLGDLYVTDWTTIGNIIGSLTDEQKHYADAVQKYLTDMGQRGNEVSEILYGIGIFNETAYFPLMSAKDYRSSVEEALNNTQTQVSLKNTGMTKQTVPHASNPIILQRFDDVAIGHIDKMAKYCTQVLAIENLRRVFDSVSADDNGGYASTKAVIEKVFGESAKKYFDQYITDLNGGTFTDGAENPWMTMFSKFKGTAVGASLSVVVQQPMAVVRAMDVINAKHFIGGVSKAETEKLYDEIKRYAPVAILKEMGGFDVGSSRTARDYLGVRTDKGFNRAVDEVNDLAMWGAGKADKLGWGIIWKAVKREVASNNEFKPGTAEFLEACGERFTEVIVRTQVYDSVNSRSGYMRSKRDSVKYATSFMGEPTTVINEAYLSMLKLVRAKGNVEKAKARRKLGRTMGVLVTSTLLTTIAKSFVYAMRDKEDDEAFLERWAKQVGDNLGLFGDLNPMTMLPWAKDIVSIFEGFGVDRPDMTLIGNAIKSARKLLDRDDEEQFTNVDEVIAFIGDTANMFGLPVKNVIRDAKGIVNAFGDIFDDVKPTDMGGAFISGLTGEEKAKADSLYDAIVSGDTGKVDAIKKGYKDDKAVESAIRKALRENDPRIKEAAKARYEGDVAEYMRIVREIKAEGHFSQDTIVSAINTEISELKPKEESKPSSPAFVTSTDYYNAIVSGQSSTAESIKNDLVANKVAEGDTQDDAEDSVVSGLVSQVSNAYKDGELSRSSAESILSKHCDKDADEIYWTLDKWDYAKQNGSTDGYSKYGEFHNAVETGKNLKATIKRYTDHGVEAKTLASQITSYFKPLYKEMSNAERANIKGYLLNAYALLGYNRFDKSKDIDAWLKD